MDTLSVIRTCLDPLAGRRILDVGCGTGQVASTLTSEGARVTGIDLDPTAINSARQLGPLADVHMPAPVRGRYLSRVGPGQCASPYFLWTDNQSPSGGDPRPWPWRIFDRHRAFAERLVLRSIPRDRGRNRRASEAQEAISQFAGSAYLGGFALIAWPAEYGNSGVMTFLVNHAGTVYQKDLGKRTESIASRTTLFDPDQIWKKVDVAKH